MKRGFAALRAALHDFYRYAALIDAQNFGVKNQITAIEQLQRLAAAHAQHAADVASGIFAKGDISADR
ncbi:hypothetical protein G6F62_015957 [Rhizopus arrhizus]|nr:hypothetical protein G6F62_015957 [Rhizopus arrhizus]